jgi:hypothetical protein
MGSNTRSTEDQLAPDPRLARLGAGDHTQEATMPEWALHHGDALTVLPTHGTLVDVIVDPPYNSSGLQSARGQLPAVQPERWEVIDDTAFSQIMANLQVLGTPVVEGGFGDEQVMRIMMLQARLGRRISEIRMLDRDPLSALNRLTRPDEQEAADGAFVAKLRYQQTKIEQAPDTILVDAEVVAISEAPCETAYGIAV